MVSKMGCAAVIFPGLGIDRFDHEDLNPSVFRKEAGFENLRIIQDSEISGLKILRQISEGPMGDRSRRAVDDHHAGGIPFRQGAVGNQTLGKREIVVSKLEGHVRIGSVRRSV